MREALMKSNTWQCKNDLDFKIYLAAHWFLNVSTELYKIRENST